MATATRNVLTVTNPATQEELAEVACSTNKDIDHAVASAKEAFPAWKETPIPKRARVFFKLQALLNDHKEAIARQLTQAVMDHLTAIGCTRVLLHSSPHGRTVYDKLGFEPTNEMGLMLR